MITLQRADSKVSAFLGEKKGIHAGDRIRPSVFTIPFSLGERKVIHNTLTGQCIETRYDAWFRDRDIRPYDEDDIEMRALLQANFLVAASFDEAGRYFKLLNLLRTLEKPRPGSTGYTILPTTACNARCVYCYELGFKHETMSEETVEQTIQYIMKTRRKRNRVFIHWFGGEPLVGKKNIDRICKALRDAKIGYSGNMISNGSLITEEIAEKMKKDWHLNNIQITLDGREEMYCERKRYASFDGSPYRAVLHGIHLLLAQGIRVNIRLNVDEDNLKELHDLTDELEGEFSDEKNIIIYCHSIFVEKDDTTVRDDEKFYQDMENLNERLYRFNRNRWNKGNKKEVKTQEPVEDANIKWDESETEKKEAKEAKQGRYYDRRGSLKRYYCMVDSPAAGGVVLPDGKMTLCEHYTEMPVIGSVWDETPADRGKYIDRKRAEMSRCLQCPLLPVCTDFTGCPTISRDCFREKLAAEKRKLRVLENERKLPPIMVSYNEERIRIKEPTVELAEKCTAILASEYLKPDRTISAQEAKELLGEAFTLR